MRVYGGKSHAVLCVRMQGDEGNRNLNIASQKARATLVKPPQVEDLVNLKHHDQHSNCSSDDLLDVDLLIAFLVAHVRRHRYAEIHEHANGGEHGSGEYGQDHVVFKGDD
jgi:hypothetical protein